MAVSPTFNAVSDNVKLDTVTAVLSYVQLNWEAAELLFPALSVNLIYSISIVVDP